MGEESGEEDVAIRVDVVEREGLEGECVGVESVCGVGVVVESGVKGFVDGRGLFGVMAGCGVSGLLRIHDGYRIGG